MSKNNGAELQLSKKGSMMHYRRLATPYLLLAPMLAFVVCFMIWPIINVFMMSTESYKVTKPNDRHFIGLENFVTIFTKDQIFLKTLGNTAFCVTSGLSSWGIRFKSGCFSEYVILTIEPQKKRHPASGQAMPDKQPRPRTRHDVSARAIF